MYLTVLSPWKRPRNVKIFRYVCVCMHAKSLQLCPTLCNPMNCSLFLFCVYIHLYYFLDSSDVIDCHISDTHPSTLLPRSLLFTTSGEGMATLSPNIQSHKMDSLFFLESPLPSKPGPVVKFSYLFQLCLSPDPSFQFNCNSPNSDSKFIITPLTHLLKPRIWVFVCMFLLLFGCTRP